MSAVKVSLPERVREAHSRRYRCQVWEHIEYDDRTSVGQRVHLVGSGCLKHHVFIETGHEHGHVAR